MAKRRKPLPPLYINMDPDDLLERYVRTDPQEVEQLISKSKSKGKTKKAAPGHKSQSGAKVGQKIVSLRDRRTAKRKYGG